VYDFFQYIRNLEENVLLPNFRNVEEGNFKEIRRRQGRSCRVSCKKIMKSIRKIAVTHVPFWFNVMRQRLFFRKK